jgi:hypothetical protein
MATFAWLPWLVGCGESTAPEGDLVEVYELVEVAGEPVPATIEEEGGASRTYVSDVIRIYDDESWDRIQELRFQLAGAAEQELTWTGEGTVVRDGDGAVLSYECNDTASCVAPDRLRFLPDGGAVIERPLAPDSALVWRYRRVGPST